MILYLPMDCEAIYNDWKALLSSCLAEALHQDEDSWRLSVVKASVVTEDDIVQQNVDVGDLV